jgi:protocatechuate 3,4-dioxygenase, beta subunit
MTESPASTIRRNLLRLAAVSGVVPYSLWAETLLPTPRQTTGPFYPRGPDELPVDDDNDLTRIRGRDGSAEGRHTDLIGRVMDTDGQPLRSARVEIWQCDANGRYHHPRDRRGGPLDENFQGYGHTMTDTDGRYRFRTIRPVPYPGRTPHIHAAVFPAEGESLVTQIYVEGEPRNSGDFLFKSVPEDRRSRVVATFEPVDDPDVELQARFDIVVGKTPEQA